ncbi:MAG: hypothetical protein WCL14_04315 [Bacteroidota bacterium]
MINYEYKVEHFRFKTNDHLTEITKFMHEMSSKGWRLASLDLKNKLQQNLECIDLVLMQKKENQFN